MRGTMVGSGPDWRRNLSAGGDVIAEYGAVPFVRDLSASSTWCLKRILRKSPQVGGRSMDVRDERSFVCGYLCAGGTPWSKGPESESNLGFVS